MIQYTTPSVPKNMSQGLFFKKTLKFLLTKPALLVILLRQYPQLCCSLPPSLPRSPAAAALLPAAAAPLLLHSRRRSLPPQAPPFLIKIFDFRRADELDDETSRLAL